MMTISGAIFLDKSSSFLHKLVITSLSQVIQVSSPLRLAYIVCNLVTFLSETQLSALLHLQVWPTVRVTLKFGMSKFSDI